MSLLLFLLYGCNIGPATRCDLLCEDACIEASNAARDPFEQRCISDCEYMMPSQTDCKTCIRITQRMVYNEYEFANECACLTPTHIVSDAAEQGLAELNSTKTNYCKAVLKERYDGDIELLERNCFTTCQLYSSENVSGSSGGIGFQ